MFAGLGGADYATKYDAVFSYAAGLAGGEYIITSDVSQIADKLSTLLAKINTPVSTADQGISLSVTLDTTAADGSTLNYAATKGLQDFSVRQAAGETIKPSVVKVTVTNDPYVEYDRAGVSAAVWQRTAQPRTASSRCA